MKKSPFIFLTLVSGGLALQGCYHTREVTTVQRDPNDSTRTATTYYEDDDVYYRPYFNIYYNTGWSYWNGGGYYHYCENHHGWFHHRHDGYASNNGHVTEHRNWSSRTANPSSTSASTHTSSRGGFGTHGSVSTAS